MTPSSLRLFYRRVDILRAQKANAEMSDAPWGARASGGVLKGDDVVGARTLDLNSTGIAKVLNAPKRRRIKPNGAIEVSDLQTDVAETVGRNHCDAD
jgi:hypothetical protein